MALYQNLFRLDRIRSNVCLKCCSFYQNRSNFSSLPTSILASFRLIAKNRSPLKLNKSTLANSFNSPTYFSIHRRFQSTKVELSKATASKEPEQNVEVIDDQALGDIPEPPAILPDADFEIADSALRNSLSYWGLDTYWPPGLVRQLLDLLHSSTGMPWWETIAVGGVFIRLLSLPLFIYNLKEVERTKPFTAGLADRQRACSDAIRSGDQLQTQLAIMEMQTYMKTHRVEPWRSLVRMIPNGVIFVSCFIGLKKMAEAPIESFKTEGALWFTDLTVGDPYWFALPLVCAVTMHFVIRLGVESGQSTEAMKPMMKYALQYGFPALILIGSSYFSSALLIYWATSNFVVLTMTAVMKVRIVRKFFNLSIQPKKKPSKKSLPAENPFRHPILFAQNSWKQIKKTYKNYRAPKVPTDTEIDKEDREKFAKSGKIPVQPTYPFNPKERLQPRVVPKGTIWQRVKSAVGWKRVN